MEDLGSILQTDPCLLISQARASRPHCPVTQLKAGSLNVCFLFVFPKASTPPWRSFPLARLPLRLWAWPASSTPLDRLPRPAWCEGCSFRDPRSSSGCGAGQGHSRVRRGSSLGSARQRTRLPGLSRGQHSPAGARPGSSALGPQPPDAL